MTKAHIGLIGLGTMGSNLALNIAEKGHAVAVYNRTASKTGAFFENAGELRERIVPCATLAEFVAQISPPRPVILMVQAGKAVDEQIAALREHLEAGDMIIDAGNANFRDTIRRFGELEGSGLTFVGMGVSGGEEGARHGPSIMVGGAQEAWRQIEPILTDIAARFQGEPCAAWLGEGGAGHFVKTIHNGIEYADMQMIAEIYGLLRDGAGLSAGEMATIFQRWNSGPLEFLPRRDHRRGAARVGRRDRRPAGRRHPRPRRPEGHRPLGGGRGPVDGHTRHHDRDRGRRAQPFGGAGPAPPGAKRLCRRLAAPAASSLTTRSSAISNMPSSPPSSPPMRRASPSWRRRRRNSAGTCRSAPWRASGAPAASSARSSSSEIAAAYDQATEPAHLLLMPAFIDTMTMASPALRRVVARARRGRTAGPRARRRAHLVRCLPSGPRHRQPHPGPARFLRRPRVRAHRRARRPSWRLVEMKPEQAKPSLYPVSKQKSPGNLSFTGEAQVLCACVMHVSKAGACHVEKIPAIALGKFRDPVRRHDDSAVPRGRPRRSTIRATSPRSAICRKWPTRRRSRWLRPRNRTRRRSSSSPTTIWPPTAVFSRVEQVSVASLVATSGQRRRGTARLDPDHLHGHRRLSEARCSVRPRWPSAPRNGTVEVSLILDNTYSMARRPGRQDRASPS